jgi:hypothetical protein
MWNSACVALFGFSAMILQQTRDQPERQTPYLLLKFEMRHFATSLNLR